MRINADFDSRHLSAAERIQLAQDLWDSLDPAEIEADLDVLKQGRRSA